MLASLTDTLKPPATKATKKSSLASGNRPGENFFITHPPARRVECVSEYIFLTSKNKQTIKKKQKKQEYKKIKRN